MKLVKLKIFMARHLPKWAFILSNRLYNILGGLFAYAPLPNTDRSLALRISRRALHSHDRRHLSLPGNQQLQRWNAAFEAYESTPAEGTTALREIALGWVHKPAGGNFGDWLSPYLVRAASGARIRHQDLTSARRQKHVISLGSIIGRANAQSIVLGAGINSIRDSVNPSAKFLMVRGDITREALPREARSNDLFCCDPGFFIREVYKPKDPGEQKGLRLLIPHINHWDLFSALGDDELLLKSANLSHPEDIEHFIDQIAFADVVVTSAMHVFVTCCAYGVRCALVKPAKAELPVPGDGIKYRDCMTPVFGEDFFPSIVDVRCGARLLEQVDTKVYEIDFDHISRCYDKYSSILHGLGST